MTTPKSMKELNLKSMFHDPAFYAKAFKEYARLSSKYEVLATWAETVFPKEVVETLKKSIRDHDTTVNILGVGSGAGSMDCNMIDGLLKSFPKVANTVLEPAKDHIDAYKKLAAEKGYNTSDWKWRQQGWDDFVRENGGKQKYHFISSIHSLYYMDDLEKTVLGMLDRLEEGGVLMAIMVADDSGFRHLWHHFSISDEMFTPYHSSSVQKILEKHGYEFKVVPQESYVDVTSCFEEGNVIGRLVVNFLLHVVDFHESAPADFVQEVMTYLGGPECSVKRGDKHLFNNFWDAILVTKKSKTGSK